MDSLELYLFREVDLRELAHLCSVPDVAGARVASIAAIVGQLDWDQVRRIGDHLRGALTKAGWPAEGAISGVATYFPEVSSARSCEREIAHKALVNAARLAHDLGAQSVEVVCGSRLDLCGCSALRWTSSRVTCTPDEAKQEYLCGNLARVVEQCVAGDKELDVAFSLEMETGPFDVLRDARTAEEIVQRLDAAGLRDRVGLNLDFSHYAINGLTAKALKGLESRVVNAHMNDSVGFHMQDVVPGTYHRLVGRARSLNPKGSRTPTLYNDYAKLLWRRAQTSTDLPFTGALSIELEFCGWISWLRESVRKTRFLIDVTRPRSTRPPTPACLRA